MPKYAMKMSAAKKNKPKAAKKLKGKQSKIDADKDGKITKKDFMMLKMKKKKK